MYTSDDVIDDLTADANAIEAKTLSVLVESGSEHHEHMPNAMK